jgi:hypothetical protein
MKAAALQIIRAEEIQSRLILAHDGWNPLDAVAAPEYIVDRPSMLDAFGRAVQNPGAIAGQLCVEELDACFVVRDHELQSGCIACAIATNRRKACAMPPIPKPPQIIPIAIP